MPTKIYKKIIRLILPYWLILILSSIAAILYVLFNSLSIWLTASLINNIIMDFDKLLITHKELVGTKMDLNAQLKFWTNQFILRDTPKGTLKILCLSILFVFIVKNIFLYIKNMGLTFIQFRLITKIRNDIYDHFHKLTLSFLIRKKVVS